MRLSIVNGKNFKSFIQISELESQEDFDIHETIKKAVSRSEYKPFIQSLNKTISYSYMYNETFVPSTFLQEIKKLVKDVHGIDLFIENEDSLIDNDLKREDFDDFVKSLKVPEEIKTDDEKYKFQQDSVFEILRNKIGRIEIGTSGGKTFITYMFCRYCIQNLVQYNEKNYPKDNQKILIIVPSKLLAKQLKQDFTKYQKYEERKLIVETIYAGSKKIFDAEIVCGTYQSLSDYDEDYFSEYRFIICDEVHRAKAYSIREEIYNKIKNAEYFFGMSGTYPKYNTLDYIHIVSMYGPLLYRKTIRSLIDDGISTPINLHIINIDYLENKFSRNLKEQGIVGTEKYHVEKDYFQGFESRTELICKLLKAYIGNSLILVDTVEYCHVLKTFISNYFSNLNIEKDIRIIHGKISDRDQIIQDMKDSPDNFILIGTYGTMSTGVSIPNMEAVYFVDGGKSDIRIRQSIGRGIRLSPKTGKTHCEIFDFIDNMATSSFKNHGKERLNTYKEQELEFKVTNVKLDNTEYSKQFISDFISK